MKTLQRIWRPLGLMSLAMWAATFGADMARANYGLGGIWLDLFMTGMMGWMIWGELKEDA